jgi:hypothetical protein
MTAILRASPAILFLVVLSLDVSAADWKNLEGTYAVTGANYLDPSVEEPRDSHLRIQLTGDAARDLYLTMKVVETPDECTGAMAKRVGEMQCLFFQGEKNYECHFSVDVMKQEIEYGVAC